MNLGKAILDLRRQRNVRQKELATACGITQSYVSSIEKGNKMPELKTLRKICEFFEVPIPILMWNSLEESDVADNKKEAFRTLKPFVDEFIKQTVYTEALQSLSTRK